MLLVLISEKIDTEAIQFYDKYLIINQFNFSIFIYKPKISIPKYVLFSILIFEVYYIHNFSDTFNMWYNSDISRKFLF